jgi:hypothetical protein
LKYLIILLLISLKLLSSETNSYEFGQGYKFSKLLTVGSYISTEYEVAKDERSFTVDDIAVLAYGEVVPSLTYLAELEAVKFYKYEFKNDEEQTNKSFHIERLYLNYHFSDNLVARVGKQITPIGYWNLEPINVLRDTTSNPYYSKYLFPKFLTGVDLSGYTSDSYETKYHVFGQKSKDLDEDYINIPNKHFFGASIEHELNDDISFGGSVGQFKTNAKETFEYVQVNAKYDNATFVISSEFMLRNGGLDSQKDENTYGGYIQALYHYNPNHAFVSRYEHFYDKSVIDKDQLLLLGYSYRPIYPVSFKIEYQWHELKDQNKMLSSFSVLF